MMRAMLAIIRVSLKHAWSTRAIAWLGVGVALPAILLPLTLRADGTTAGAQTMVLTYTPIAIFAVLLAGAIWLAAYTLAAERIHLQFAMLRTKPVSIFAIWFGKWLTVLITTGTMLALATVLFFAALSVRFEGHPIVTTPSWTAYHPDDTAILQRAQQQLDTIVRQTTDSESPHIPSLQQLANRLRQQRHRVAPGTTTSWQIPVDTTNTAENPWELHFQWRLDPMRRSPIAGTWSVTTPDAAPPLAQQSVANLIDGRHTISFPSIPRKTDTLILTFTSAPDNEPYIFFDNRNPVALLQQSGILGGNLMRAAVIMMAFCAASAALALTISAFFSFPVTVFTTHGILLALLIVAIAGQDVPTVRHAHGHSHGHAEGWMMTHSRYFLDWLYRATEALRAALPFRRLAENIQVTFYDHTAILASIVVLIPLLCATLAYLKIRREEVYT